MTEISVNYHGLTIKGELIEGDSMGDPTVPNGEIECPPYIDDLAVYTPDGYDITEEFADTGKLQAYAIKEALG